MSHAGHFLKRQIAYRGEKTLESDKFHYIDQARDSFPTGDLALDGVATWSDRIPNLCQPSQ